MIAGVISVIQMLNVGQVIPEFCNARAVRGAHDGSCWWGAEMVLEKAAGGVLGWVSGRGHDRISIFI